MPIDTGLRVTKVYVRVECLEYCEYVIVTRRPLLLPLVPFPRVAWATLPKRSILLTLPHPREEICQRKGAVMTPTHNNTPYGMRQLVRGIRKVPDHIEGLTRGWRYIPAIRNGF
jgi:hypothetical protein